ncbi:MAG TPA: YqaJ viral recombinase family protein [Pyrinomonadaceae bacterium]|nr:YqaJ viral recombinase family protein [Pyrinomonadaceae bacterium]
MLTAEQLDVRRGGIGSSDIAGVCGLSEWASPLTVWLRKTGQDAGSDSLQLRIGSHMEPLIAALYTERTGDALTNPDQVFRSGERPWQLATPDRLRVRDDGIVELKNAYMATGWGEEGTDDIPQEYVCQVQWQMDVMGAEFAHVAAIVGRSFRLYSIRYDSDLCLALREAAERFWTDYVVAGVQPPVSANDNDRAWLQGRFASHSDKLLIADESVEDMARRYRQARLMREAAEAEEDLAANQLREFIGAAAGVNGERWKATWKAPKPTNIVDWKAVAEELCATPDVVAKHTSPKKNSRRFLFTWKGGE